jgi:hypothetical protein
VRKTLLTLGVLFGIAAPSHAQWVVYDPAVTYRNSVTAVLKEVLVRLQQQQHSELRRMAHRLSMFTSLAKYRVPDPPRWRTHDFEGPAFLFARDYHAALNYGDGSGRSYLGISHPLIDPTSGIGRLPAVARRALSSHLATLDLTDAAVIAATHDTGQLRYNGRRELAAIEGLERDVTNDSLEQSTTAVLDKISGAGLIGARQRQARIQLLDGVVEQLLVENKRARDTEAAAMNMQLTAWRDRAAANQAFVAGTGDALRTWRQP